MRQRGFATGDLLLWGIVIAGVVAAIAAAVVAWDGFIAGLDQRGYERGVEATESAYRKRDNQALRVAQAAQQAAETRLEALEQKSVSDLAKVATDYEGDLAHERGEKNRALDQLRSGALVLRDPGAPSGPGTADCRGGRPAEAGTGAGERDGAAPGQLSRESSAFLLELAGEADELAKQLAAAQAVILRDREVCR